MKCSFAPDGGAPTQRWPATELLWLTQAEKPKDEQSIFANGKTSKIEEDSCCSSVWNPGIVDFYLLTFGDGAIEGPR